MTMLLAQVSVSSDAVKPALSLLDNTVIGSVLVVVLVICIVAVVMLIRVQNSRVADQKALNEKSEALMTKMITAFTDMKSALDGLRNSLGGLQAAENATQQALAAQQHAFELTLIMRGRSPKSSDPPKGRE